MWTTCVLVGFVAAFQASPDAVAWRNLLVSVLERYGITRKTMAYHMRLTEQQVCDQLALRVPMHAPRLADLWAAYPDAYDAFCIEQLSQRGYRCYREAWLLALVDRVSDAKKPMASMELPSEPQKASA